MYQVESIKDRLLANNEVTSWVPAYVKEKRFHNWLEGAHDWAISRSRWVGWLEGSLYIQAASCWAFNDIESCYCFLVFKTLYVVLVV